MGSLKGYLSPLGTTGTFLKLGAFFHARMIHKSVLSVLTNGIRPVQSRIGLQKKKKQNNLERPPENLENIAQD